jgi:hypothetical protein
MMPMRLMPQPERNPCARELASGLSNVDRAASIHQNMFCDLVASSCDGLEQQMLTPNLVQSNIQVNPKHPQPSTLNPCNSTHETNKEFSKAF